MISIIVAIGKNNEIGKKNALLWSLPADMKHFRETTAGKTVIMGQKTFESLGHSPTGEPIGRPLPNRRNIVLSQDISFQTPGVEIVHSLEELDNLLKEEDALRPTQDKENFIIGGGQIYRLFIDKADKLYITHVDASFPDADTFFPEIDKNKWQEISREEYGIDEKNPYAYAFVVYTKII
jgi:dihydrofolate reductase